MSVGTLLPREVNKRPLFLHTKWSILTCWPGREMSFEIAPTESLTFDFVVVGTDNWHCFPNWHAAQRGLFLILTAAVWRLRLASPWASTPVRNKNFTLLQSMCANLWCHLSNSFSGSVKFLFASATTATNDFISSCSWLNCLGSQRSDVGKLFPGSMYAWIGFVFFVPPRTNLPSVMLIVSLGYCFNNDEVLSKRWSIDGTYKQGNSKVRTLPFVSSKLQLTIPTPSIKIFAVDIPVIVWLAGADWYSPSMNSDRSLVIDIDDPESQITVLVSATSFVGLVVVAERKHDGM